MPVPYSEAFRQHAKQHLDAQVYDTLHKRARGTAGGTALRNPAVREIRFDGTKYSREQVVTWLRQNNYNEAGLQPDGQNWLYQAHGGLPMQDETTRSLGAGITAVVGRYRPEAEGQKGGVLNAITKIFKSILCDATREPASAPEEAGGAFIAKADIDPAYFDAAALLAGQDYYAGLGQAHARTLGLAMVEEDAEAFEDERQAWTTGPRDLAGLDVHLGSGSGRMRGHFGFDVLRKDGDHGTVLHDLSMGIPLPTASARVVLVTKELRELADDPARLARDIRRVLMPGGRLLSAYGAPVAKDDDVGGLVYLGHDGLLHEYVRIVGPAGREDIGKALEGSPGFELHRAGVSDAGIEAFAGMPEAKRAAIRKALDPQRTIPMVTASPQRQILYCTVLEPDTFDSQGDVMDADDIEYTAHRYLTKSRVIGSGHNKAIQARPVESFIAPQDLFYENGPFGPQQVRKGSWVIGIHVEDPGEWQKVLEGEYTGVSIGGFGLHEDLVAKDFNPDQPRGDDGKWGGGGGGGERKPNYGQKGDDDTRSDKRHFARQQKKADKEVDAAKAALAEAKAQHADAAREHETQLKALQDAHEKRKADIAANLEKRKAEITAKYAAKAAERDKARADRQAKRTVPSAGR